MTPPAADALFITGWGHAPDSLAPLRAELGLTESSPLLSPAGLAGADPSEPGEFSAYAAELLWHMQSLDRPAPVIGWSMGAMIALEAAALAPDSLRALVLLAPTARFCSCAGYRPGVRGAVLEHMIARIGSDPEQTLREFMLNAAQPQSLPGPQLADALGAGMRIPAPVLAQGLCYLRRTDLRDRLARVRVPVLIIHGDADRIVPCGASETVAGSIPGASRTIIPGAGHLLPRFDLDRLSTLIIQFLASLP